ncbi:hypothetical protein JTT07_06420 [Clostridium botulinum]|nr:hypothetical protein [Clostridium botulinum]
MKIFLPMINVNVKIIMGSFAAFLSRNSKKYFNNNKEMQLLACDLSFDYLEELDVKILIMQYQKTHTKSF